MKLGKTVRVAALSAAAIVGVGSVAFSADMAKAIDYRQNVMKAISANASDIVLMLKGDVPFDAKRVALHATSINALAKIIPDMVPAGSGSAAGKTNAKDEIWSNMADFDKMAAALESESAKLVQVAQGGDQKAIAAQVGVMGKQCGACHQAYRKPLS